MFRAGILPDTHEGGHAVGDGFTAFLVSFTAGKNDVPGYPVGFSPGINRLAGLGRAHVVHAQVQRRAEFKIFQGTKDHAP